PAATATTVAATPTATMVPVTATVPAATAATGTPQPTVQCVGNIRGSKTDGRGRGLAGWTIQLLQANQVVRTLVTDAGGAFEFLGLNMGVYTVQEVQQAGWVAKRPSPITITLAACGENRTGITFVNELVSLTPTPTPVLPGTLPRTGAGVPGDSPLALLFGVLLFAAGLVIRRVRA
ncbi:MAG: prealbumin-like fold domain-containing protein, partial [Chloroflexi bacterium]|nr:prealbumin-like fold domain-containing protein [Chloroflexota bacterium]